MKGQAWEIIEMGLLASRYVVLFADSMSTASFYKHKNGEKDDVVHLENLRS
jgi:hypothetical protein